MKTRSSFVSNSSSTIFVVAANDKAKATTLYFLKSTCEANKPRHVGITGEQTKANYLRWIEGEISHYECDVKYLNELIKQVGSEKKLLVEQRFSGQKSHFYFVKTSEFKKDRKEEIDKAKKRIKYFEDLKAKVPNDVVFVFSVEIDHWGTGKNEIERLLVDEKDSIILIERENT